METSVYLTYVRIKSLSTFSYVHTYMYVRTYVCVYVFSIQMNTFISTCMYIRIRTYVCSAHTYIHVIISFHTKFLIPTQILMNVLCLTTVIIWVTTATATTQWAVTSVYVNQDSF